MKGVMSGASEGAAVGAWRFRGTYSPPPLTIICGGAGEDTRAAAPPIQCRNMERTPAWSDDAGGVADTPPIQGRSMDRAPATVAEGTAPSRERSKG